MRRAVRGTIVAAAAFCAWAGLASPASAAERYAVVISGAAGDAQYQQQYAEWRTSLVAILNGRFGFADDHVVALADPPGGDVREATRENVRSALAALAKRAAKDDLVLIVLIGHGNPSDVAADNAKFNLVGPDLSAREWADLVKPIAGRIVFVDASSGSAPFLQAMSARGRIVITATDTSAEVYETVFPGFFIRAFTAEEADTDKDGRVSVWEAFSYASSEVRTWYQQQGRLQSERALLDDNGDGVGREAQSPGADGDLARAAFLDAGAPTLPGAAGAPPSLTARRAAVQAEIDRLRARRAEMSQSQYESELERLLIELANIDVQLRSR